MKDVHNKEIKAGDICHILWQNQNGPSPVDILATAVRTRGRGIKFITDDEKSITVDELNSVDATVIITSRNSAAETEQKPQKQGLSQEEVQIIEKLKSFGWSGTITKETNSIGYRVTLN